jgi:hypothetical protein
LVGQACNVNPKALIVTLEKEQSLVDDDWPWPIQYRSAMGYGCPDTAACDSDYYGFFNQVYNAARQFKRYGRDANLFNYRANTTSFVGYNPQASCGGSNVFIQNAATAALYNYTPYQPNAAALNNMYGSGDSCSAYGNRNFWRMYNDWFGTTFGDAIGPLALNMFNPGTKTHYVTARENARWFVKKYASYQDAGIAFVASATQQPGMVPVYDHYNSQSDDHWLTVDGMNHYWALVIAGYRDDGIATYAYPANPTGSATPCSQGTPVYSLWHGGNTDHFFTTNPLDRYWALIYGGYVDDQSAPYSGPTGRVAFCSA